MAQESRNYRAEPFPVPPEVEQEAELRRVAELKRKRRANLRRIAWRVVQALKDPKLTTIIEPEIRSVGGGVEALAAWEAALRAGRELTPAEIQSVSAALQSTPLEWALLRVDSTLDQAERAERDREKKHGGKR